MRGLDFYRSNEINCCQDDERIDKITRHRKCDPVPCNPEYLASTKEYQYISSIAHKDVFHQKETDRLNQVYTFVLKNFSRKISLHELADLVYMTPTSFSRYFTMRNNKSFSGLLQKSASNMPVNY